MNETHTILIIDDDETVCDMLTAVLSASGYRVLAAGDGRKGLGLAQSERPGMILCDGCMPGMTGVEVVNSLKGDQATAGIPVIMMSGKPLIEGLELWRDSLFFLQKPFTVVELIAAIKSVLPKAAQGVA